MTTTYTNPFRRLPIGALLVVLLAHEVCAEIIIPRNVAIIQGGRAIFECGSSEPNNTIAWYGQFYELDSEMDRCLYTGLRVTTDYRSIVSVEIVDNVSSLWINHTTLSIAGTYICKERRVNRKSRAELIVLESEPVCITNHTSTDNTTLELSCSVSFRGNWAPIMEWREEGSVNVITSDVINQTMANDSVSYSLTVPLNVSRKGVRYTCTTRFIESMRPSSTNATNVPDLTFLWTSPLLNFSNIDKVKDTHISSHSSESSPVATIVAIVVGLFLVATILVVFIIRQKKCCSLLTNKCVSPDPDLVGQGHEYSIETTIVVPDQRTSVANSNIGADGTIYADVTLTKKERKPETKTTKQNRTCDRNKNNNKSGYLEVDHTVFQQRR